MSKRIVFHVTVILTMLLVTGIVYAAGTWCIGAYMPLKLELPRVTQVALRLNELRVLLSVLGGLVCILLMGASIVRRQDYFLLSLLILCGVTCLNIVALLFFLMPMISIGVHSLA